MGGEPGWFPGVGLPIQSPTPLTPSGVGSHGAEPCRPGDRDCEETDNNWYGYYFTEPCRGDKCEEEEGDKPKEPLKDLYMAEQGFYDEKYLKANQKESMYVPRERAGPAERP